MCEDDFVWIFGYGSLIWRPGFPYVRKINGYIKGWKRRFYQGSTDHRGVPGAPGRVVTVIEDPNEVTWGACYCVTEAQAKVILAALDYREKGGYERRYLDVYVKDREEPVVTGAIMYIGSTDNPEYLGEAPIEEIARTIATSVGPSGPNRDYFFNLARGMREMNVVDPHIEELEVHITRILVEEQRRDEQEEAGNAVATTVTTTTTTTEVMFTVEEKHHHGVIYIDDGAVQAISNLGKSLLSVGITGVEGEFSAGQTVLVCDSQGRHIARGKTNYSSEQISKIKGMQSGQIAKAAEELRAKGILVGPEFDQYNSVVVTNSNMILV